MLPIACYIQNTEPAKFWIIRFGPIDVFSRSVVGEVYQSCEKMSKSKKILAIIEMTAKKIGLLSQDVKGIDEKPMVIILMT